MELGLEDGVGCVQVPEVALTGLAYAYRFESYPRNKGQKYYYAKKGKGHNHQTDQHR